MGSTALEIFAFFLCHLYRMMPSHSRFPIRMVVLTHKILQDLGCKCHQETQYRCPNRLSGVASMRLAAPCRHIRRVMERCLTQCTDFTQAWPVQANLSQVGSWWGGKRSRFWRVFCPRWPHLTLIFCRWSGFRFTFPITFVVHSCLWLVGIQVCGCYQGFCMVLLVLVQSLTALLHPQRWHSLDWSYLWAHNIDLKHSQTTSQRMIV